MDTRQSSLCRLLPVYNGSYSSSIIGAGGALLRTTTSRRSRTRLAAGTVTSTGRLTTWYGTLVPGLLWALFMR